MRMFNRLFHRCTWKPIRTEYRYNDRGQKIVVKRCQCRGCGKIEYFHFNGREIIY